MFYRIATDGTEQRIPLIDAYAGTQRTACWIIGGGPSLAELPTDAITNSALPKFAINLAGHGLLRPTFWTAYDPTNRFQRSTYLDPSILKFVPRSRAMDLVPGTSFKVCDSPQTVFFDRDQQVGFHDFLYPPQERFDAPRPIKSSSVAGVTDWQDSLIQAIHIAYLLGFRTLYMAGCDMFVSPSTAWCEQAKTIGVEYIPREPLKEFHQRCLSRGMPASTPDHPGSTRQYHFDESKPLAAAMQTDLHYFRVAQYLRLSRRAISLAGMELISVTPESRLNDYFSYQSVDEVCSRISTEIGQPHQEPTRGLYTESVRRTPAGLAPMRDFRPHHWGKETAVPKPSPIPLPKKRLAKALDAVRDVPVSVKEEG